MPIDPNIIMGIKPVQLANPLEQYMQVQQIQQAQSQSRLQDLMWGEKQRDVAADRVAADAMASGGDVVAALAKAGYGRRAVEQKKLSLEAMAKQADIDKTGAETQAKRIETAGKQLDLAGQAFGWVKANPSVENAKAAINWLQEQGVYTPEHAARDIAKVDADPNNVAQLADMAFRAALSAKDQLPKIDTRNLGGTTETFSVDPVSGTSKVLNTVKNTVSPDTTYREAAADRRQKQTIAKDFAVNGMTLGGTPLGDVETMAQGIASGKLPPLSGFALARPRGQTIMARVMELNPDYDAGDYAAKNSALKGFSTGKEGTALRSFNVAIDHLDTLGQMADALNNDDTRALNTVANAWAKQTGSPAPTNFNAVKEIVGKEVMKAIVAGGGGVEERREMTNLLDAANSPAQLRGVVDHFKELMSAQKAGLLDQYERTTGRTDGEQVFAARRHGDGNRGGDKPNSGPSLGAVESGADGKRYRYKGGDPGQASSWEAVR